MSDQAAAATAAPQLTADQRAELAAAISRALAVLRVPAPLRLSQWAEKHFYLSAESSYVEGRWRCWPPQRPIMDLMGHDEIHHVTIRKSARVGYTKMLLAYTAYCAEHKRRNAVIYQPTDDDRDDFVTGELEPMLRDVKVMRRVMPRFTRRSKDNTLRVKKFTTGMLYLRGGKAAKNYRRLTVDSVVYDEFSGFDRDIEKEGSPGKLGDKRLEGSIWPKSIAGSTPKIKHNDNTEDREAEADAHMRWKVPCWHCHELHEITMGMGDDGAPLRDGHGLIWRDGDPSTVAHACPHCGGLVTQAQYLEMWDAGLLIDSVTGNWVDAHGDFRTAASIDWRVCELAEHRDPATIAEPPGHVAIYIWTAAFPQATWVQVAEEHKAATDLAARGDKSLLKTWRNTTHGQTWEDTGEAADEHALQARVEQAPPALRYSLGTVPIGALVLTCGVDVQRDRWEIEVWGWGVGMESWLVDSHVIHGNPADEADWELVGQYLQRRYPQVWHGGTLPIEATSIDSSDQTQAVYNFVRKWQHRIRVHAIKGSSEQGKPIKGTGTAVEVNYKGQRWPNGVKVWTVGVDTAKDLLHGQLQIERPGPGYVHMPQGLPREWYEQLTAEHRVPFRAAGGEVLRWVKRRRRNEKLDGRNYATHSAYMLGLDRLSDARWLQIEQAVQPPRDLFSPPLPIVVEQAANAPAVRVDSQAPAQEAKQPVPPPVAAAVAGARHPVPGPGWMRPNGRQW